MGAVARTVSRRVGGRGPWRNPAGTCSTPAVDRTADGSDAAATADTGTTEDAAATRDARGDAPPASVTVAGREVAFPVEIRDARTWMASFLVPLRPAAELIAYSGLEPATVAPGRGLLSLACVRYADGDLGRYHELAVALIVRRPGARRRTEVGAFIHRLPVDQPFTCEAGRVMWGFPKFMADIAIEEGPGGRATCTLTHEGEHVLTLTAGSGIPSPAGGVALDAYSWLDGTLRRTAWSLRPSGSRLRPGGARLTLGAHPVSEELRRLGLPRRALTSGSVHRVRMSFLAPEVL